MEWELVKLWVNRVGIVLEFLSFWFAAPEILGEKRLRALERRVEREVRGLPSMVGISMLAATVAVFVVVWVLEQGPSSSRGDIVFGVLMFALIVGLLPRVWRDLVEAFDFLMKLSSLERRRVTVIVLAVLPVAGVVSVALLRLGLQWERMGEMPRWLDMLIWLSFCVLLGAAFTLGTQLALILQDKVVQPLLRVLADDKRIRQRSLAVGAVLFVVGFLLQLAATF